MESDANALNTFLEKFREYGDESICGLHFILLFITHHSDIEDCIKRFISLSPWERGNAMYAIADDISKVNQKARRHLWQQARNLDEEQERKNEA